MVLRRLAKVVLPAAGVAAATYAYAKEDRVWPFNTVRRKPRFDVQVLAHSLSVPHSPRSPVVVSPQSAPTPTSPSSPAEDVFPRSLWDYNWDYRDPLSMINVEEFEKADEAGRKKLIEAATPTATRHIIFVRHGQYFFDSEAKNLTPLGTLHLLKREFSGREQATAIGKRLAATGIHWDHLIMSTMPRFLQSLLHFQSHGNGEAHAHGAAVDAEDGE